MAEFKQPHHVRMLDTNEAQTLAPVIDISHKLETKRILEGAIPPEEMAEGGFPQQQQPTPEAELAAEGMSLSRRRRVGVWAGVAILSVGGWIAVGGPKNLQNNLFGGNETRETPGLYSPDSSPEHPMSTPDTLGTVEEREGGPDHLPLNNS